MLPNWESAPQNQPRANVAIVVLDGAAASIGGIDRCGVGVASTLPVGSVLAVQPKENATITTRTIAIITKNPPTSVPALFIANLISFRLV